MHTAEAALLVYVYAQPPLLGVALFVVSRRRLQASAALAALGLVRHRRPGIRAFECAVAGRLGAGAGAEGGAEGACWAILRERWHQFLFGFYPMDAYWRPVLAFGLMLMALAPALYYGLRRVNMLMLGTVSVLTLLGMLGVGTDGFHLLLSVVVFAALFAVAALMPKKLLWLTLVYPLVGFYLLWGGSVWGPVGVAIGFGLLVVVWNKLQSRLGAVVAGGIAVAVALIWWLQVQPMVTTPLAHMMPIRLMSVDSDQFGGFLLSFVIGVTAVSASLPMGLLLALGRRSDMVFIKSVSVVFIEFIRGVPLITCWSWPVPI